MSSVTFSIVTAALALSLMPNLEPAKAWGDEGHEVVALIADHYLSDKASMRVHDMLMADTSSLTAHDIASEATWADKFRDSDRNTTKVHYNKTHNWHFADIELADGDLAKACSNFPKLPAGAPASEGASTDCAVDKINQFAAELASPQTSDAEKLLALKFLLHFVGDIHQPLHSSDDHDAGGNGKNVSATGFKAGKLHHYWDTEFVALWGTDPQAVADTLISDIGKDPAEAQAPGDPSKWAEDAFVIAKEKAYGALPAPGSRGGYRLDATYIANAKAAVHDQLSKAGVRLAGVLNTALGH